MSFLSQLSEKKPQDSNQSDLPYSQQTCINQSLPLNEDQVFNYVEELYQLEKSKEDTEQWSELKVFKQATLKLVEHQNLMRVKIDSLEKELQ